MSADFFLAAFLVAFLAVVVVLDFGRFQRWGPLAPVARGWLRLNHVETLQPYERRLGELLGGVEVEYWLGGYCFVAVADRSG